MEGVEGLYVGINTAGYILRYKHTILDVAKSHDTPIYYAMLPVADSKEWRTTYTEDTFKPDGTRLVVFQLPAEELVCLSEERAVVAQYEYLRSEARRFNPAPWAKLNPDKPLTYVFVKDLPKYVVDYINGEPVLKHVTDPSSIIHSIEENF